MARSVKGIKLPTLNGADNESSRRVNVAQRQNIPSPVGTESTEQETKAVATAQFSPE
jgi:hypothetical protein